MNLPRCLILLVLTASTTYLCSSCSKEPDKTSEAAVTVVDHAAAWESRNKSGLEALSNKDLSQAETDLVAGLSDAEACGSKDPRVAVSLNNLASLYESKKMYSQCTAYLKRSRDLFRNAYGDNYPAIAITLKNQARVLGEEGKYAEAEPFYKDAIARFEKSKSTELSTTLTDYADLLRHLKKNTEADSVDKKAATLK